MVAPSPDWFAALASENLLVGSQWVAQRTVPVLAYNAGTDSGPTLTAPDQPTVPAERIQPRRRPAAAGSAPDEPSVSRRHLGRIR